MYEESNAVELKLELINKVKNEILAFVNTDGGTVYIGVDDNGNPIGIDSSKHDDYDSTVSNWVREAFYPNITPFVSFSFNDDNVMEIKVLPGTMKPYYFPSKGPVPSGVYIRVGRSSRKATQDEIIQMMMESRDVSFETEIAMDQDLTFDELTRVSSKYGFDIPERKFATLGLNVRTGEYTNLAYILSDQSNLEVKFAVYKDTTRSEFKVKKEFQGSLLKITEQLLDYANLFNDVSAKIEDDSPKRKEVASYPSPSLREIIMNSICHADFSLNSNIKIEFFTDRLEVLSPGSLFGGLTIDDVLAGRQMSRNPRLVNILNKLGLIENYGTGIERTLQAYKEYKLNPEFDANTTFFVAKLPNVNYFLESQEVSRNLGLAETTQSTTQTATQSGTQNNSERILELIKSDDKITIADIADQIGITRDGVNYHIRKLKERHMLVRIGSDSVGRWQVRDEIDNPKYLEQLSEENQIQLINWCKENFEERKSFNGDYTSYGLKHKFEKNNFYITNGQFKGAMIKAGFKVENRDELNWVFNISQKSKGLKIDGI